MAPCSRELGPWGSWWPQVIASWPMPSHHGVGDAGWPTLARTWLAMGYPRVPVFWPEDRAHTGCGDGTSSPGSRGPVRTCEHLRLHRLPHGDGVSVLWWDCAAQAHGSGHQWEPWAGAQSAQPVPGVLPSGTDGPSARGADSAVHSTWSHRSCPSPSPSRWQVLRLEAAEVHQFPHSPPALSKGCWHCLSRLLPIGRFRLAGERGRYVELEGEV